MLICWLNGRITCTEYQAVVLKAPWDAEEGVLLAMQGFTFDSHVIYNMWAFLVDIPLVIGML